MPCKDCQADQICDACRRDAIDVLMDQDPADLPFKTTDQEVCDVLAAYQNVRNSGVEWPDVGAVVVAVLFAQAQNQAEEPTDPGPVRRLQSGMVPQHEWGIADMPQDMTFVACARQIWQAGKVVSILRLYRRSFLRYVSRTASANLADPTSLRVMATEIEESRAEGWTLENIDRDTKMANWHFGKVIKETFDDDANP